MPLPLTLNSAVACRFDSDSTAETRDSLTVENYYPVPTDPVPQGYLPSRYRRDYPLNVA